MKHYKRNLVGAAIFIALAGGSASAAPVDNVTGGAKAATVPSKATVQCTKSLATLKNTPAQLDNFAATYYIAPTTAAELANYPPVNDSNPLRRATYKADGPDQTRRKKVNYQMVYERFIGAYGVLSAIPDLNKAPHKAHLDKLKAANDKTARLIASQLNLIEEKKRTLTVPADTDCAKAQGQKAVQAAIKARAASFKLLNQGVVNVRKATQEARRSYQPLDAKRVKLEKAAKNKEERAKAKANSGFSQPNASQVQRQRTQE